ncbi:MAG: sodium-dependent transporter, partial [Ruminiclostridium sp.]
VIVVFITEERKLPRKTAVLISAVIVILFGVLAALSANSSGILSSIKLLGMTFFDFFDSVSSNILLPLGGLLIAIFIGYFINKQDIKNELSNNGTLKNTKVINVYLFLLRFVTPVLLLIVFLSMIGVIG